MATSRLLPRSGIGVDGSHLIIAPPGNPVIRLDCRLLDRVELIGRSPTGAFVMSGAAASGIAVGAALFGLGAAVVVGAGLAYFAHERFSEGRRRLKNRDLLLSLGSLSVALHVADGPEAAKRIADQLSPYTRAAPITRPEVYEDARRRLEALVGGRDTSREAGQALHVGASTVTVSGGRLHVGDVSFRVEEVREYALRGANLPLPGGRMVQAAMGLLIVAADQRAREGDDVAALTERIRAYEEWTGRSAGR